MSDVARIRDPAQFLRAFGSESLRAGLSTAVLFPVAAVLFCIVFSLDRVTGNRDAKVLFAGGQAAFAMLLYTVGVLVFPRTGATDTAVPSNTGALEGINASALAQLVPFRNATLASYFVGATAFTLAYWMYLNYDLRTPECAQLAIMYCVVLIMALFFFMLTMGGEWQAAVLSAAAGIVCGMLWAHVAAEYMRSSGTASDLQRTAALTKQKEADYASGTRASDAYRLSGTNQNENMLHRSFHG